MGAYWGHWDVLGHAGVAPGRAWDVLGGTGMYRGGTGGWDWAILGEPESELGCTGKGVLCWGGLLVLTGAYCCLLVHTGAYWFFLVHTTAYWSLLGHTGSY